MKRTLKRLCCKFRKSFDNLTRRIHGTHKKEAISILEAVNFYIERNTAKYQDDKPRALNIYPALINKGKIKSEVEFDRNIKYLKKCSYLKESENSNYSLTDAGKDLLNKHHEMFILRKWTIFERGLKNNFTTIISMVAVVISLIALCK